MAFSGSEEEKGRMNVSQVFWEISITLKSPDFNISCKFSAQLLTLLSKIQQMIVFLLEECSSPQGHLIGFAVSREIPLSRTLCTDEIPYFISNDLSS